MAVENKAAGRWNPLSTPDFLNEKKIDAEARILLSKMRLEEKIHQMSGDIPFIPGLLELGFAYNSRPYPAGDGSP